MATLHAFRSAWEPAPRPAPPATTLLAVGDVHGHAEHLDAMLALLRPVAAGARAAGGGCALVMVGDYVDRGPDSLGVLRRLPALADRLGGGDGGVPVHLLRGNHDQFLLDFLAPNPRPSLLELWWQNGGGPTLASVGVPPGEVADAARAGRLGDIAARLRERLGPGLVRLLEGLAASVALGQYLFVHGGVHPRRPLEAHGPEELMWLREPFLSGAGWAHPFAVVHGHTPLGPQALRHRVGIDSGCFFTSVLTAVEIEGHRLRFHHVASEPEPAAFLDMIGPERASALSAPEPLADGA